MRDWHVFMWQSLEFWMFSTLKLWNQFCRKPSSKNWSTVFLLKVLGLKMQHFRAKLPCQKPMLRQIKWGVQDGPITKNKVLAVTTSVFRNFCFSLRNSYKKSWFGVPTTEMSIFMFFKNVGVLFEGAFSVWESLKVH